MPPYLITNSSDLEAPTGIMDLRAHPTIPIDLTPEQLFESDTGILDALSSDVLTLSLQYWITTRSILPMFTQDFH